MIYFVQRGSNGPIKIGQSVDPRARIRSLQTASPERLVVLAFIPGDRRREAEIHRQLHAHRSEGEWFAPTEEVLALMAELQTPEYRIVGNRAYAVLRRPTENAPSRPCPFCGLSHSHDKGDGHRVAHCPDAAFAEVRSEGITMRRTDGYYVETDGAPL